MNTLERFVLGVQTTLLVRVIGGDLRAAALAPSVVIAATFVDPECIDGRDEPVWDERLLVAVEEYCDWQTGIEIDGQEMPQPAWLRFTLGE